MEDMRAVIGAMKWSEKPLIAGHSGAGPTVIAFAADYPNELAKLVLVDSQMNRDEDAVAGPTVGNPPLVFPSIEAGMAQFAKLNIGTGKNFDIAKLSPELKKAVEDGMADAWQAFAEAKKQLDAGKLSTGDIFGTREYLKNNYMYRMLAAVLIIYGNSKQEALYPVYTVDASGQKLDAAQNRYTLHFAPGQLPPVNAFWSLTMYELPSRLLVANPLNRYLINSPMLPDLKRDPDGGVTLYIQHDSPGRDKEANWLPAPSGPFLMFLRLFWPKPEALEGKWKQPPLQRAE